MKHSKAFTLVELLVVIGVIALLISVLMPALSKAREQAQVTKCLSNIRQLAVAWSMYANDHKGSLVWAETGSAELVNPSFPKEARDGWVIDVPPGVGSPDVPVANTEGSIRKGLLWKYAPNAETYRCPSSFDMLNFRSYSISAHLNSAPSIFGANASKAPIITKISKAKNRLVFIEEYDTRSTMGFTANQGSFMQSYTYLATAWIDTPAIFHKKGTTMSFADGHAEYRIWSDKRTLVAKPLATQPKNLDMYQLREDMYGDHLVRPQ